MARLKVAVLISGRGSNLQSLIDHCADPAFPAEIVLVLSNRPGAAGLARAEAAGLTKELVKRGYSERDIGKIWSGNFLRAWQAVEKMAEK